MSSLTSASLISSACASVLMAMNSTPLRPASIMRLTALTPPPPIPTTLITAMYEFWAAPAISASLATAAERGVAPCGRHDIPVVDTNIMRKSRAPVGDPANSQVLVERYVNLFEWLRHYFFTPSLVNTGAPGT